MGTGKYPTPTIFVRRHPWDTRKKIFQCIMNLTDLKVRNEKVCGKIQMHCHHAATVKRVVN